MLGLDLGAAAGAVVPAGLLVAAVGGVLVLDVDVLDIPLLPSCLVGLLVGLLKPLRPALAAGVGLDVPITALPRLPDTTSCFFRPLSPLDQARLLAFVWFAEQAVAVLPVARVLVAHLQDVRTCHSLARSRSIALP
jgi:hypothetical protein